MHARESEAVFPSKLIRQELFSDLYFTVLSTALEGELNAVIEIKKKTNKQKK
jgi:hypothetical protein